MFFTLGQSAIIASLALAYIAFTLAFSRSRQRLLRHVPTLLGCTTFSVAAFLAAKNLIDLLTTTKDVTLLPGKTQTWKFIINPSDDPFFYFIGLALQFGTILLCLVLAYGAWSNRPVDKG
ncbi:hypothetical protein EN794_004760 [Mesorhizobium sp. M00.F.Ca.ET.151.01.1.1]|nr:hypothetical protein EN842_05415 [bacterium M00.F.Ca.ET.199.01.1.1]TGT08780.1 hypothetical protein EN820_00600 [bacterium M00.F.Ca.ET.177.01.1.1]TGT66714.1 hypothetical protein EN813_000600 [Mesorhizobium sp. M00.F.Ca.ET.170.01.1.1]TGU15627.1 hypothetical protein EN806_00600 [bacterium M00.F.Ca.ET.163.01.1.1]TGU98353.1 hypothetical protein EN794_004760 [Mesorhizobium sp. M00.F.Ca.ET.151.01.1.1]TGV60019.1 hypothetical protein EN784_06150 [bacterium M00.F.Ca.ET.141.01.1.1]